MLCSEQKIEKDKLILMLYKWHEQRLSIARSFMNQPKIIFADEPTGNLDKKNSENITRLLFDMCETYNTSLVIVTHDKSLSSLCNRQFLLDQFTLKPRF